LLLDVQSLVAARQAGQANASARPSSANRGTVTRRSPWTRDARATLHPAANGNSPCPQLLEGGWCRPAGHSGFAERLSTGQSRHGCRHTGVSRQGSCALFVRARKVKIDVYVIHGCVSKVTITTSHSLLAPSSKFPGRGGLCHVGRTARSTLDMDTTLREDSVLCTSKYQTCTPSAPCRELRNACSLNQTTRLR
jgi:hypothetical protein